MDVDHKHMPSTGRKCYNCGQVPATRRTILAVETQPAEIDLAKEMREMREELRKLREENAELRKRCEDF
jgi:transposase-like protein